MNIRDLLAVTAISAVAGEGWTPRRHTVKRHTKRRRHRKVRMAMQRESRRVNR